MIEIREAVAGDGQLICQTTRLLAESHGVVDSFVATAGDYDTVLSSPKPLIGALLAFHSGVFAGSCVWHRSFSTNRGREIMFLEDLFVLPEFRQQGIATALLAALAKLAVMRGYPAIWWFAMAWNNKGLALYRRLGAKTEDQMVFCRLTDEPLQTLASTCSLPLS